MFTLGWNLDTQGIRLSELGTFGTWVPTWMGLSIVIFGLHLAAGVLMIRYSRIAPTTLTAYGVFALLLAIADILFSTSGFPPAHAHLAETLGYARVGRTELREWDELHAALLEPALLNAFETIRDSYVASVERHEVQHRLDYARDTIELPAAIAEPLGAENVLAIAPDSFAARTRDELSAHLAALAQAPGSPLLELLLFARHMFSPAGPYTSAAFIAFRGLGEELGIDVQGLVGNRITPPEATQLLLLIAKKPDSEVRRAANDYYHRV
jgi:hypothetical protein